MTPETLTFHNVEVRAVVLKLKRPVVAKIATITDWPLILIDLKTEEGVVGRSYLEPYIVKSMNYLVPALRTWGRCSKAKSWRRPKSMKPRESRCTLSVTRACR